MTGRKVRPEKRKETQSGDGFEVNEKLFTYSRMRTTIKSTSQS